MSPQRKRLVQEAFQWLDANGNGTLEISEVKSKFDPTRHPDVLAGVKTVEEARFSFFDMFTTFHNASTGFSGESSITFEEFLEYHMYLNDQFDKEAEFRNFLIGVWNMDIKEVDKSICGKKPEIYGKNSREQWKRENHQVLYGKPTIVQHDVENGMRQKQARIEDPQVLKVAGTTSWNADQEKGGQIFGEMK